jgi:hypothetical protein
MNETELFDRYLSKEMSDEERQDFEKRLNEDNDLRKAFQLHVSVIKELDKQSQKDDALFGEAMKNISEDDLHDIIDNDNKSNVKTASAKIVRIKTYWLTSVAAILIVGAFSVHSIKSNYNNKTDNLLVEYNAGTVARGEGGELTSLIENIVSGKNLEATAKRLNEIYDNGNQQDRPIAGWYLALSYIKQHDHEKAISTLKSLQQKYPEFAQSCGAGELLNKLK